MGLVAVPPALTFFWILIWGGKDYLANRKFRNYELVVSRIAVLCCMMCLIPFGVGLPTFFSLNYKGDLTVANVLTLYFIPALSLLCLVNVSGGAIAINSTFLDLVKEKLAKKAVELLKIFSRKKKVAAEEETLRYLFDITYKDEDEVLLENLINMEHKTFDVALTRKGSVIYETHALLNVSLTM